MFHRKIGEIIKDIPNVFATIGDILAEGHDRNGTDHDKTLHRVVQICRKENLKLNKDKCYFRCTSVPFFGEIFHARHDTRPEKVDGTH